MTFKNSIVKQILASNNMDKTRKGDILFTLNTFQLCNTLNISIKKITGTGLESIDSTKHVGVPIIN